MSIKKSKKETSKSAFSFKWDSAKKSVAKGKAFVRQRGAVKESGTKALLTEASLQINAVSDKDEKESAEGQRKCMKTLQTSLTSGQTFVKRKQRKDKSSAHPPVEKSNCSAQKFKLFDVRSKVLHVGAESGKSVSEKVFSSDGAFSSMGVHPYIVSNLEKHGFTTPTNVQTKSIPVVLSGRNTLIRSQTGSGKTLAYAVPIIEALHSIHPKLTRKAGVQALIVVPTRELAMQTHELFTKINSFQWLIVGHLCGGESRKTEKDRLKKGVHVLISTPGRLLDHVLHSSALHLEHVRCLVLDEADRLLDMGFRKDIVSIVEALDSAKAIRCSFASTADESPPLKSVASKLRQNLMLSATLTEKVSELARFVMLEHTYIDALDLSSSAFKDSYVIPDTVRQEFIVTHAKHRLFVLTALLLAKTRAKLFVFMASTKMVEFHYDLFRLHLAKMPRCQDAGEVQAKFFKLHGSMGQTERKQVFHEFRASTNGVLICSDVVARGIDVPDADCIIQYTAPQTDEDYLHRVGRTGRAGHAGNAILFLTYEEQDYVEHLRKHRVFLQKCDYGAFLKHVCELEEQDHEEEAVVMLQRRFETAVERDSELYKSACFAFSTWSRFYNSYPQERRAFFDFKKVNLGHFATSFALQQTPTTVARSVREQLGAEAKKPKLNMKLANHRDNVELLQTPQFGAKRKINVLSEFDSGLTAKNSRFVKETVGD